jgi:hypothetical protein
LSDAPSILQRAALLLSSQQRGERGNRPYPRDMLRAMGRAGPWLFVLMVVTACGDTQDGDGPADGAATAADIEALCGAVCAYEDRCAREADPSDEPCTSQCISDGGGNYELYQRGVARALRACFAELECNVGDDACISQVLAQLGLDAITPLAMKCVEVQDECGGFSEDFCATTLTATAKGRGQIDECLSASCDAVSPCIEALRNRGSR